VALALALASKTSGLGLGLGLHHAVLEHIPAPKLLVPTQVPTHMELSRAATAPQECRVLTAYHAVVFVAF